MYVIISELCSFQGRKEGRLHPANSPVRQRCLPPRCATLSTKTEAVGMKLHSALTCTQDGRRSWRPRGSRRSRDTRSPKARWPRQAWNSWGALGPHNSLSFLSLLRQAHSHGESSLLIRMSARSSNCRWCQQAAAQTRSPKTPGSPGSQRFLEI